MPKLPINGDTGTGAVRTPRHTPAIQLLAGSAVVAGLAFATYTAGGPATRGTVARPSRGVAGYSGTVTVTGRIADGLYPGGSRPVTFTAANPGSSAVTVGMVRLAGVSTASGCAAADFTMPDVLQDFVVSGDATATVLPNAGTFSMADTPANQDTCKGTLLTLALSSTWRSDANRALAPPSLPADGSGQVTQP